jgi:ABC-type nitrate/sulfonate/bicarbonate transport system ATPase subunit
MQESGGFLLVSNQVTADSTRYEHKKIELRQLHKNFGSLPVLHDLNLEVQAGEFVSLIGPSGCGKSTIFSILAGLTQPDQGQVLLDNVVVQPQRGKLALMPQRDSLLPWRTVLDNTTLALELHGLARKEARRRALALFATFGLAGFEHHYPWQLSGGMRQRVAMLRTVLAEREVLLLDEPFGALDALTRAGLQSWLLQVWEHLNRTIIFITHDVEEALLLSDRVYVLTARPATVSLVQTVSLPRPRQPELVTTSEFVKLKAELLVALKTL